MGSSYSRSYSPNSEQPKTSSGSREYYFLNCVNILYLKSFGNANYLKI